MHGDFRITARLENDEVVAVVHTNGSYSVRIAEVSIGVYKLGDHVDDDIHGSFPDPSPTKRAYAERNRAQLALFDAEPDSPLPEEARYALTELIVAHFGNPRDGFAKWYAGAPTTDERGIRRWAWISRQDVPGEAVVSEPERPPMVPFDAREVEDVSVRPRPDRRVS